MLVHGKKELGPITWLHHDSRLFLGRPARAPGGNDDLLLIVSDVCYRCLGSLRLNLEVTVSLSVSGCQRGLLAAHGK